MPDSIESALDITRAVRSLLRADPRFARIHAITGDPPLRRVEPTFASLLSIITDQMLSRHSAQAIWNRTQTLLDPLTPESLLAIYEDDLRNAGQSRAKIRTFRAIAQAITDNTLDLETLADQDDDAVITSLTAIKGVGQWTAHIYLLTCLGRPNAFPAADVALQSAAQHAFDLNTRPTPKELLALAEPWLPHRATAARLLWAYYKHI
jgi:DNA-3-methyladenine glycosylase II